MKFWSYWGREDTKHNSKGFTHFYSPPKQCQWYVKYFLHNALEEIFWEYPSTNSKDSQSFNYTEEISECKDMKKVFILLITTSCLCCPLILNGVCQYVIVHVAKHEEKLTEKQMEWGDRRRGRAEEGWKKRVFGDGREGDYFNRSMDEVGNRSTREADERKISNSLSHLNAQRSFFFVLILVCWQSTQTSNWCKIDAFKFGFIGDVPNFDKHPYNWCHMYGTDTNSLSWSVFNFTEVAELIWKWHATQSNLKRNRCEKKR